MAGEGDNRLEAELRGRTLQVYWCLLKSGGGSVGVRSLQRALGYKRPSAVFHHLEKLKSLGLVEKTTDGEYVVSREVKVGFLKLFVKIGRFRFPRFLLYAVFTTSLLVAYVTLYNQTLTAHNLIALIFGFTTSAILWYETLKALREIPV
ncbi:MAG: hypothetical protein QXJ75_05005 [Candidatus Bathyarchaeia archaeon]